MPKQPTFSDTLMDHFLHPRHAGQLGAPDGNGWSGERKSNRYMNIQLRVDQGRIVDVRFKTYGCAPAIACGSYLCEHVFGGTVASAAELTSDWLSTMLGGLPKGRRDCADLAIDALQSAIEQVHNRAPSPG